VPRDYVGSQLSSTVGVVRDVQWFGVVQFRILPVSRKAVNRKKIEKYLFSPLKYFF